MVGWAWSKRKPYEKGFLLGIWTYTFQLYIDCNKTWIQGPVFNHPVLIILIYFFCTSLLSRFKAHWQTISFLYPYYKKHKTYIYICVYLHRYICFQGVWSHLFPKYVHTYIHIYFPRSNPLPPTPFPPFTAMVINSEAMNLPAHESLVAGGSFGKATMRQIWREKWGKNSSCGCGCCLGRWCYNFPAVWGL